MTLSRLPGPWEWQQRGDKWWRVHIEQHIEDGPHDAPFAVVTWPVEEVWERCEGCGREYRFPHLCRRHHLCGLCHPPIDRHDDAS